MKDRKIKIKNENRRKKQLKGDKTTKRRETNKEDKTNIGEKNKEEKTKDKKLLIPKE